MEKIMYRNKIHQFTCLHDWLNGLGCSKTLWFGLISDWTAMMAKAWVLHVVILTRYLRNNLVHSYTTGRKGLPPKMQVSIFPFNISRKRVKLHIFIFHRFPLGLELPKVNLSLTSYGRLLALFQESVWLSLLKSHIDLSTKQGTSESILFKDETVV